MKAIAPQNFARQHVPQITVLRCILGVLDMEWRLAIRDPALPLVIICLLAFCQVLMPGVDAPYAVLTVNRFKPLMSASPLLLATGAIFGAIAFPVYLLFLGSGTTPTMINRTAQLYLSSSVSLASNAFGVILGRILAQALIALSSIVLVLVMLCLSVFIRLGEWPGSYAIISYFVTLIPVTLAVATLAVALNSWIVGNTLKSWIVFGLWMVLLALSALGSGFDLFGLGYLAQNIFPGDAAPAIAIGFVAGNISTIDWKIILQSPGYVQSRIIFALGMIAFAIVAAMAAAVVFRARLAGSQQRHGHAKYRGLVEAVMVKSEIFPEQFIPKRISATRLMLLLVQQALKQSTWAKILFIVAALLAAAWPTSGAAAAISLLVPIALFRTTIMLHKDAGSVLRHTTSALWRPTPHLLECMLFTGLVALPLLPLIGRIQSGFLHVTHFFAGIFAASAWLVYTHRVLERELLGVSLYLLVWYVFACHQVPSGLDLFALHGTSISAWLTAVLSATLLGGLITRADTH